MTIQQGEFLWRKEKTDEEVLEVIGHIKSRFPRNPARQADEYGDINDKIDWFFRLWEDWQSTSMKQRYSKAGTGLIKAIQKFYIDKPDVPDRDTASLAKYGLQRVRSGHVFTTLMEDERLLVEGAMIKAASKAGVGLKKVPDEQTRKECLQFNFLASEVADLIDKAKRYGSYFPFDQEDGVDFCFKRDEHDSFYKMLGYILPHKINHGVLVPRDGELWKGPCLGDTGEMLEDHFPQGLQ